MTTVSSTLFGRFGGSPSVYEHDDDISAISNVTPHHSILTFIRCLQAEFEERGSNSTIPQINNNKSFLRLNINRQKFLAFSYDVFIYHIMPWLDHNEYGSGYINLWKKFVVSSYVKLYRITCPELKAWRLSYLAVRRIKTQVWVRITKCQSRDSTSASFRRSNVFY